MPIHLAVDQGLASIIPTLVIAGVNLEHSLVRFAVWRGVSRGVSRGVWRWCVFCDGDPYWSLLLLCAVVLILGCGCTMERVVMPWCLWGGGGAA